LLHRGFAKFQRGQVSLVKLAIDAESGKLLFELHGLLG